MLPSHKYIQAIDLTQVVSLDLIVRDPQNRVLVGMRTNEPARNTWFVPGGRVWKNETRFEAIPRLSKNELGITIEAKDCRFLGVNDHIYDTNFAEARDEKGVLIPTHYVCLAFETKISEDAKKQVNVSVFKDQHSDMAWMTEKDLIENPDVHEYTRKYFTGEFCWVLRER